MLKLGNREERETGLDHGFAAADRSPAGPVSHNASGETIIGEHLSIEGKIRADENVLIEGTMKGTIEVKSHQLTIGPKGQVEADVEADSVVVSGRMVGNINARTKVQVTKSADFSGQIKARRIAIEDGAFIKASIELERDEKSPDAAHHRRPIEAIQFAEDPARHPKAEPARPVLQSGK